MAFQQGLSGLNIASKALDVTSNNIANASTVGFKQARAHFADVYASSLQGSVGTQVGIGGAISGIAQQFTQGNLTSTSNPLDLAINGIGFFAVSPENTDSRMYTRNGQFHLDKNGYITNDHGYVLRGTLADSTGVIPNSVPGGEKLRVQYETGSPSATTSARLTANLDGRSLTPTAGLFAAVRTQLTDNFALSAPATLDLTTTPGGNKVITIPTGNYSASSLARKINELFDAAPAYTAARASVVDGAVRLESTTLGTGTVVVNAATSASLGFATPLPVTSGAINAFNPSNSDTYTHSSAMTVYDSLGNPHTQSFYFIKTPAPGEWKVYAALDGVLSTETPVASPYTVTFNNRGQTSTITPSSVTLDAAQFSYSLGNGANAMQVSVDLADMTQYGTSFAVGELSQDGYTAGNLSGISISKEGIIQARYDNGQTKNVGQIALFDFRNPHGLGSIGNNLWTETSESGQPTPGTPAAGIFGSLQGSATEDANVDMTAELVNMIVQQRNYQANAQSIKTQDQLLQTLVNLR